LPPTHAAATPGHADRNSGDGDAAKQERQGLVPGGIETSGSHLNRPKTPRLWAIGVRNASQNGVGEAPSVAALAGHPREAWVAEGEQRHHALALRSPQAPQRGPPRGAAARTCRARMAGMRGRALRPARGRSRGRERAVRASGPFPLVRRTPRLLRCSPCTHPPGRIRSAANGAPGKQARVPARGLGPVRGFPVSHGVVW
jgi:hypothetical protein